MPTTVVVTTSPVSAASPKRAARTKVFRGRRRAALRRALAAIRVIMSQDERERLRADALKYVPALVAGSPPGGSYTAFATVRNRLAECLGVLTGEM